MPADTASLKRNTLIGLIAGLALAAFKLAAGILGNSSALIADGVESFADVLGSAIVLHAFRVGARRPDPDHPYGYGRAETVAALSVGALLLVAALVVADEAVGQMLTTHAAPAWWTLLVLAAIVIVKEGLFRLVRAGAREHDSDAANADAWHHRSDAITSAAAFIGVAIAVWGPPLTGIDRLVFADEVAALIACVIIVITAVRLIRPAIRELLDAASHETAEDIRRLAAPTPGVRRVEKVIARKAGRGYLVDMHLQFDPDTTVEEAHAIAGRVKADILTRRPAVTHVLTHIEPVKPTPPVP